MAQPDMASPPPWPHKEVGSAKRWADAEDMLSIMVEGKRLRDISDLPLDLAV